MTAKLKPKKCRMCGKVFKPFTVEHVVCGWECAEKLAGKLKSKEIERGN